MIQLTEEEYRELKEVEKLLCDKMHDRACYSDDMGNCTECLIKRLKEKGWIKKTKLEEARELFNIIQDYPDRTCELTKMSYHQAVLRMAELYDQAIKEAEKKAIK